MKEDSDGAQVAAGVQTDRGMPLLVGRIRGLCAAFCWEGRMEGCFKILGIFSMIFYEQYHKWSNVFIVGS